MKDFMKIAVRFIQGRSPGSESTDQPVLIKNDQDKTYGDLQRAGILNMRKPLYEAYDKAPFYYSELVDKKIVNPDIKNVVGAERANQLLNNISAHKEWSGLNDAKIVFVPNIGRNAASVQTNTVAINALDPGVIHHELGHLATTPSNPAYRAVRSYSGPVGLGVSALALAAEKVLGIKNPGIRSLKYIGAMGPVLGAGLKMRDEYNASKNATEFIKTHYPQEDQDQAKKITDAGFYSHLRSTRKPIAATLMALMGNLALEKK